MEKSQYDDNYLEEHQGTLSRVCAPSTNGADDVVLECVQGRKDVFNRSMAASLRNMHREEDKLNFK